jgi:hypothetical protein
MNKVHAFIWVVADVEIDMGDCAAEVFADDRALPHYVDASTVRRAKEKIGEMVWINTDGGLGKQLGYIPIQRR